MKTDDFKSIENQFFIQPSNPFKSGYNYLTRNSFCTLYKQGNWVFHGTDKVVKYRKNWGLDGVLGKNLRGGYSDLGIPPQWDSATMGSRPWLVISPRWGLFVRVDCIWGSFFRFRYYFFVSA
jgi:hypothetical protein